MKLIKFSLIAALPFLLGFTKADFVEGSADTLTFQQKFQRRDGQTEFYNAIQIWRGGPERARSAPESAADEAGSGQREFVESDVFAINLEDKLVYLLNNYRGLQVVSFEDGATEPKLLSRVAPTGNFPDKMFYDKKNHRLIVLESTEDRNKSRLLVYDVSDKNRPKLRTDQTQVFEGRISAERFDVTTGTLYIVASEYYYYWGRDNQQKQQNKGFIYAYDISGSKVQQKQRLALSLPSSSYRDIRLSEVEIGGQYKYYVTAILHKGYGSQDDRLSGFWAVDSSYVEVVDITDPDLIQPLLVASVKGQIRERSQIQFREDTLIVVSNFNTFWSTSAPSQIAVETFHMPSTDLFNQPANDAELIAIERMIEAKLQQTGFAVGSVEYNKRREELVSELLRGRYFVKELNVVDSDGAVRKAKRVIKPYANQELVPDNPVGVANVMLQEVRMDDKYLYAFWVPRDLKDPLEVFDIRDPKNIKYLKRLAFKKGWVEKAIPFKYNDQHLVMGLGFHREEGQSSRSLVGVLAHIQERPDPFVTGGTRVTAEEIDFKVLDQSDTWASLNIDDKEFTVSFSADGEGFVLMPHSRYSVDENGMQDWESGGLKFQFSMNAFASGEGFFSGSTFLPQNEGYLKRIFVNPIINRENAFSDKELAIFGDVGSLTEDQRATAVAYLELARNIRAYVEIGDSLGLQIVDDGKDYCYWRACSSEQASTDLRFVSIEKADSELHEIKKRAEIAGSYQTHLLVNNQVYVLTNETRKRELPTPRGQEPRYEHYEFYRAFVIGTQGGVTEIGSFEGEANRYSFRHWYPYYGSSSLQMSKLEDGTLLVTSGQQAHRISSTSVQKVNLQCGLEQMPSFESLVNESGNNTRFLNPSIRNLKITVLAGKPFASYEIVQYNQDADSLFAKNMLSQLQLNATGASCTAKVNIPGTPQYLVGKTLVTHDSWIRDLTNKTTEQTFNSLALGDSKATLKSMIKASYSGHDVKLVGNTLLGISVSRERNQANDWMGLYRISSTQIVDHKFSPTAHSDIEIEARWTPSIEHIIPNGNKHLIAMTTYRKMQIIEFDGVNFSKKLLQEIDPVGDLGEKVHEVKPSGWGFYNTSLTAGKSGRLHMSDGLYGVRTFIVE